MTYGAAVSVKGDIIETKLHKDGIEMQCSEISLVCPCNEVESSNYYWFYIL